MKKRALILTAVLTAAALTGGSGYLPVTDGIRAKMIQNVYADAEDSKESADTETSDSVLDQATIMYQQYNYDEAIKLLQNVRLRKNHWLNILLKKSHMYFFIH